MRRNDGRDYRDRATGHAHVEQDAHHRDAYAVGNRNGTAHRRPDELLLTCKEPERRDRGADKKHRSISQRGAEARAEKRPMKSATPRPKALRQSEKGRNHAQRPSNAEWRLPDASILRRNSIVQS